MLQSKRLQYFLAAVDAQRFSAAAAELGISQPALSRSIKQLEDELGVSLFKREARGVALTRYGEILERRARSIEREADLTASEIEALKSGKVGLLRVGAGPLWLRVYLPPAITTLQGQRPGLRVELSAGVVDTLVPKVLDGELDVACTHLDFPGHQELTKVHLTNVSHTIIAHKKHPLVQRGVVALKELLDYPWVTLKGDYVRSNRIGAFFASQNLDPPDSAVVVSPGGGSFNLLGAGDYLSTVPTAMLPVAELNGCVRILTKPSFWESSAGLVYRTVDEKLPTVSSLAAILRAQFEIKT